MNDLLEQNKKNELQTVIVAQIISTLVIEMTHHMTHLANART